MKFGKYLEGQIHLEWKDHYLDYRQLKRVLKILGGSSLEPIEAVSISTKAASDGLLHPPKEEDFAHLVEKEISKVNAFTKDKAAQIRARTEKLVLIAKSKQLQRHQIQEMDSEIEICEREIILLERYININATGFLKILKKHDKHSTVQYGQAYMVSLWRQPFLNQKVDDVITCLGMLQGRLRLDEPVDQSSFASLTGSKAIHKTIKYWVRMDHVTQVKFMILKRLPILPIKQVRGDSQLISSIYLDNRAMEMYSARIFKSEGAPVLKIRWQGVLEPTEVVFEMKEIHTHWTGDINIKKKLVVQEPKVLYFFHSLFDTNQEAEELRQTGTSSDVISEQMQLAKDIQKIIAERKLLPTIRTAFTRTTFQHPQNPFLRATLDVNVNMMIEKCKIGEWKRDTRRAAIPENHTTQFPFAVLKFKITHQVGDEPPQWIQELVASGMITEVPKFSKYIHGCAVLLRTIVPSIPHWLRSSTSFTPLQNSPRNPSSQMTSAQTPTPADSSHALSSQSSSAKNALNPEHINAPKPVSTKDELDSQKVGTLVCDCDETGPDTRDKSQPVSTGNEQTQQPMQTKTHDGFDNHAHKSTPTQDKPVVYPMKISPNTYFSNERTFIAWIKFSLTICLFALGLFGMSNSKGMKIGSIILLTVGATFSLYAYYIYVKRNRMIKYRYKGPLDDMVGTGFLVLVFNFGIIMSALAMFLFPNEKR